MSRLERTQAGGNETWLPRQQEPDLVSVVIPAFNRAGMIGETIGSVFRQDYRPIEIIVADDASTDEIESVVEALDPPDRISLKFLRGEKAGACVARNRGAEQSRGEFIMFLDSDDLLTVPALTQLVTGMRESHADVSCGLWRDMKTGPDACTLARPEQRQMEDDWLVSLLRNQWLATCALLFRREALLGTGPWREECVLDGDLDFSLRLSATGAKLAMTPQVVAYYRRHADQMSTHEHKHQHTARVLRDLEALLDQSDAWTPERRSALAWRYYWTARMTWFYTDDAEAFERLMREAKRVDPGFAPPKSWYRWIASLAGYRTAERVAAIGRRLFR